MIIEDHHPMQMHLPLDLAAKAGVVQQDVIKGLFLCVFVDLVALIVMTSNAIFVVFFINSD
jgi:hypothetical protein